MREVNGFEAGDGTKMRGCFSASKLSLNTTIAYFLNDEPCHDRVEF
jgi:hypothetical protein